MKYELIAASFNSLRGDARYRWFHKQLVGEKLVVEDRWEAGSIIRTPQHKERKETIGKFVTKIYETPTNRIGSH